LIKLDRIAENYHHVVARIAQAARQAGRDPLSVKLVVVTKTQPVEAVQAVIRAGASVLGENYVEEAVAKMQTLACLDPADGTKIAWHMIGHVQSRKAEAICDHFAYLHALDSEKLARRLDRYASQKGRVANFVRPLPVLLECNVSGEESKFGFAAWDEQRWPDLLPEMEAILGLQNLAVRGLMTMPPYHPDPEASRSYFRRLRGLQDFLAHSFPQVAWRELSMGMSADFEVAVQEGATWVRVGQAILGPR